MSSKSSKNDSLQATINRQSLMARLQNTFAKSALDGTLNAAVASNSSVDGSLQASIGRNSLKARLQEMFCKSSADGSLHAAIESQNGKGASAKLQATETSSTENVCPLPGSRDWIQRLVSQAKPAPHHLHGLAEDVGSSTSSQKSYKLSQGDYFQFLDGAEDDLKQCMDAVKEIGLNIIETKTEFSMFRCIYLEVATCGTTEMPETCSNWVKFASAYDVTQIASLSVCRERYQFVTHGNGRLLVAFGICRLNRHYTAGQRRPESEKEKECAIVFPFLYRHEANPLTTWCLVNSKDQVRPLVIVPGTASDAKTWPFAKLVSDSVPAPRQADKRVQLLHVVWGKLDAKKRALNLRIMEPSFVIPIVQNLQSLLSIPGPCSCGFYHVIKEINLKIKWIEADESLCLLNMFDFRSLLNGCVMPKLAALEDTAKRPFLDVVQQFCPKLLSGQRIRLSLADRVQVLEPPAKDLQKLQRRLAQLLEQWLWDMIEDAELRELANEEFEEEKQNKETSGKKRVKQKPPPEKQAPNPPPSPKKKTQRSKRKADPKKQETEDPVERKVPTTCEADKELVAEPGAEFDGEPAAVEVPEPDVEDLESVAAAEKKPTSTEMIVEVPPEESDWQQQVSRSMRQRRKRLSKSSCQKAAADPGITNLCEAPATSSTADVEQAAHAAWRNGEARVGIALGPSNAQLETHGKVHRPVSQPPQRRAPPAAWSLRSKEANDRGLMAWQGSVPSRCGSNRSEHTETKALPEEVRILGEESSADLAEDGEAAGSQTTSSPSDFDDVVDMVDPLKQFLKPKIGALQIAQAWRDSVDSIKAGSSPSKLRAEAMLWRQLNLAILHDKGKTHRRFWGLGKEECFICQGRRKPAADGEACLCYSVELLDLFEQLKAEPSSDDEADLQQNAFPCTPDSLDDRPMGSFHFPPEHWVLAHNWTKYYTCAGMPAFSQFPNLNSEPDVAPVLKDTQCQEVLPATSTIPTGGLQPEEQQLRAENEALRTEAGNLRGTIDELRVVVQNMSTEAENEREAFQVAMRVLRDELEAEKMKNRAHEQKINELEDEMKGLPERLSMRARRQPGHEQQTNSAGRVPKSVDTWASHA